MWLRYAEISMLSLKRYFSDPQPQIFFSSVGFLDVVRGVQSFGVVSTLM